MLEDCSGLLADREPLRAYGVAVTEREGDPRVVVGGHGMANRYLRWDGDRVVDELDEFRARSGAGTDPDGGAGPMRDPDGHALGVAAGDADGDGEEEVYVHNAGAFAGRTPEVDRLLDPDPDGFADLFADQRNREQRNPTSGRSVAALDRTGEGEYSFLVTGYAAPTRCYRVDGGLVRNVAGEHGLDFLGGGRTLVTGPLVGERQDVFLGMERGPNLLLCNDGGGFTDVAPERGVSDTHEAARGATLVDTGDGVGLALGNWEGHARLHVPEGGYWREVAPPEMAEPGPVRTVLAADLDNDGRQELFFNHLGAPNRLFARRDGEWTRVEAGAATEPEEPGTGAAVVDLDGDGRLELLVAHGERDGRPLSLYRAGRDGGRDSAGDADRDANGWLRVRPRTVHGAPARGAVVDLWTDAADETAHQRRVIDGGSGYLCAMEPVAHFGLGSASPERLAVRWPDGETTAEVDDLDENRVVTVPHPGS